MEVTRIRDGLVSWNDDTRRVEIGPKCDPETGEISKKFGFFWYLYHWTDNGWVEVGTFDGSEADAIAACNNL